MTKSETSVLCLGDISKFRSQLMGLAALLILVVHSSVHCKEILPIPFVKLLDQGNYGVDIFFFVSGIGLVYSLAKTEQSSIKDQFWKKLLKWYTNRYKRILAPYWVITLLCVGISVLLGQETLYSALLHFLTLSYWLTGNGAWFISILLILYFLSPLFYSLLHKKSNGLLYAVLLSLVIMMICQYKDISTGALAVISGGFVRTPSFFIGMAMAKYVMNNRTISFTYMILYTIISFFITISLHFLFPHMYSKWLFIIPVITVQLWLIRKSVWVNHLASFLGPISLESYLYNIYIHFLFNIPIVVWGININYGNVFEYMMVLIIGTIMAYYTHKWLSKFLSRRA